MTWFLGTCYFLLPKHLDFFSIIIKHWDRTTSGHPEDRHYNKHASDSHVWFVKDRFHDVSESIQCWCQSIFQRFEASVFFWGSAIEMCFLVPTSQWHGRWSGLGLPVAVPATKEFQTSTGTLDGGLGQHLGRRCTIGSIGHEEWTRMGCQWGFYTEPPQKKDLPSGNLT